MDEGMEAKKKTIKLESNNQDLIKAIEQTKVWSGNQEQAIPIKLKYELDNLGSTSSPDVFYTRVEGQECFAKRQNITPTGYGNIIGQFAVMRKLQNNLSMPDSRLVITPSKKIYLLTKAIPQPLQTNVKSSGLASFYYKNYRFFNIVLDTTMSDVYNLWESTFGTIKNSEFSKNNRLTYTQKIYSGFEKVHQMININDVVDKTEKKNYDQAQIINVKVYKPLKNYVDTTLEFLKTRLYMPILDVVVSHGDLNFNNILSNKKSIFRIQDRGRKNKDMYKLIDPGVSVEGDVEDIVLFELVEEVAKIWVSAISLHAPGYRIIHNIDQFPQTPNLYNHPTDILIRPSLPQDVIIESYNTHKWQYIDRTVSMYHENIINSLEIFLDKMQDVIYKLSQFSSDIFNLKYYIFAKLMMLAYLASTSGFEQSYKNIMTPDNFIAWEAIAVVILENFESLVGLQTFRENGKLSYRKVKRDKNLIFTTIEQVNEMFGREYGYKNAT